MTEPTERLLDLYREAYKFYVPDRAVPPIEISFYPYVGINHTIRVRDGRIFVRIGDICSDMPPAPHKGLAYILVGKLLRKRLPKGARDIYLSFIKSPEVMARATKNKREMGRKVVTTSKGLVYDLDEIFERLNVQYFGNSIEKPALTWSARKTYRILGHHDATHGHIAISRSLDSADVPLFVVESVVYHEMLHIAHPTKHVNGRRYNHTAAFRRDERKYTQLGDAERWIERNVRKLKKAAQRQ